MAYPHAAISKTTRFPNGVTTASPKTKLSDYKDIDPTKMHVVFDDFDNPIDLTAASPVTWTNTAAGSSTVTQGTGASGLNGRIILTTGASSTNSILTQAKSDGFKLSATSRLWIAFNAQLSQASDTDFLIGLQVIGTTPLTANTQGVYYYKANGAATGAVWISDGTSTTKILTVNTVTAAVDFNIGIAYNPFHQDDAGGTGSFEVYVNNVMAASRGVATVFGTGTLAQTMFLKTNSANARTAQIDYLLCANEVPAGR